MKAIGGTIYFTEIPKKHVMYNARPEDLTKANFDKTIIFKELLYKEYKNGTLLIILLILIIFIL